MSDNKTENYKEKMKNSLFSIKIKLQKMKMEKI